MLGDDSPDTRPSYSTNLERDDQGQKSAVNPACDPSVKEEQTCVDHVQQGTSLMAGSTAESNPSLAVVEKKLASATMDSNINEAFCHLLDEITEAAHQSIFDRNLHSWVVPEAVTFTNETSRDCSQGSGQGKGFLGHELDAAGQLFAYQVLCDSLPNFEWSNWKSSLKRSVCVHKRFNNMNEDLDSDITDIIYDDSKSRFDGLTETFVFHGLLPLEFGHVRTKPTYFIDVQTTLDGQEESFMMSASQVEMMNKMTMPAEADKARTIYVIARIYKLGQKGMGMELIVDPQTALEQGELHIEPDRYKVTLGKRRLPDDAKRLIPENAFAPSDSTSNFRSTSPEMIATSGREVENDRIMEASPSILTGPSHTQQYSPPRRISGEEQTREKEEEHNMTESTDVHASTLEDSPPLLLPGIESKEKMGGRRSSDDPLQHPGILSTNITSPKPNGSIADGLIEETLHLQDTNSDSGHRDQNNRPFSIFSSAKSAGAGALSIPGSEIQKSPIEWPTSELPKGFRFPADESVPKTSAEDTSKSLDLLKDGAKDAALLYQLSDDPLMTSSSSQFPFAKPHPSQAAFVSETSLSNPQPGNPTFNTATHTQFLSYLEYDNHVDIIRQYQSTGFTPPESFWSFEEIRIGAYNGVTKVDWPLYHEDFQCIGFGPPYEGLSFEEVRLQHYLQAKEPRDYQSDDDNWDAALCEG